MLVEFEKKILTGGIFFKNWGHFFSKLGALGQMCEWNLKKKFNWGHFFKNWGQWGKCGSGI